MKKLFLAVALVAATFSANATVTPDAGGGCTFIFDDADNNAITAAATVATVDNTVLVVKAGQTWAGELTNYTNTYWTVSFGFDGSGETSDKNAFKFGSSYIQADGSGRDITFTGTSGDKIYMNIASKGSTENTFPTLVGCTDANPTVTMSPKQSDVTKQLPGVVYDASGYAWVKKEYTMTSTTATLTCAGGWRATWAAVGTDPGDPTSSSDAIAADVLSKVGNDLVNPTNLEVTVISVAGGKVLTSSASSISVAGLASGVYVAVTAEGTLKFVK